MFTSTMRKMQRAGNTRFCIVQFYTFKGLLVNGLFIFVLVR